MRKIRGTEDGYAIRVGRRWVSRFSYPSNSFKPDREWMQSEGILIAACCKALLGSRPYVWPSGSKSSAEAVARWIQARVSEPVLVVAC